VGTRRESHSRAFFEWTDMFQRGSVWRDGRRAFRKHACESHSLAVFKWTVMPVSLIPVLSSSGRTCSKEVLFGGMGG